MKNNPYIGPRPYGRGEGNFFGREREGKELAWLILAEQAVLFYAQSGAGKTSLLNARVIPILEKKGVQVLPVARVGSGLPASIDPGQVENIFVFSALMGLADEKDIPPEALLKHSLLSFLQEYHLRPTLSTTVRGQATTADQLPAADRPSIPTTQYPLLLIFDQFEEIATTHREHWDKAEGFFRQVREAIDALPGLGVLFVLREDYAAELDPYTPLLPSHLQARFRMTLPTRQQAMQIVMGPAEQAGCRFDEEAAHNLVNNLSRIKAGRQAPLSLTSPPMGGTEGGIGPYVEPVQLQVVCQQLWASLPEAAGEDHLITWDEIKHYDVDQALTNFYENTLAQTCQVSTDLTGLPVTERRLRRWFSEALITPEGRRGLALQGEEETAGLPNAVVKAFEDHHLIRAEVRGGSRWYELSHDRLVEPIVQANADWQAAYANPLVTVTQAWLAAGRAPKKLLRGAPLAEAQAYANQNPAEVNQEEKEFLAESLRQEETERELARQAARRRRNYIFIAAGVIVALTALAISAWLGAREAAQQKTFATHLAYRSRADELAALHTQAVLERGEDLSRHEYGLALLLAREAVSVTLRGGYGYFTPGADAALRQAISAAPPWRMTLPRHRHTAPVWSAVFSPDGKTILTASEDQTARLWDATTRKEIRRFTGHTGEVLSATFSPDGQLVLTASGDNTACLWKTSTGEKIRCFTGHTDWVRAAAFSPDGQAILTAGDDKTVRLWDAATGQEIRQFEGHTNKVRSAVFSPDGKTVLTAGEDNIACLWKTATGEKIRCLGHAGAIYSAVFSPDGQLALTASGDKTACLWKTSTGEKIRCFQGHKLAVSSAILGPDGQTIVTTSADRQVCVWSAISGEPLHCFTGHTDTVLSAAFSPDGQTLLTADADNAIRFWDVNTRAEICGLEGHLGRVNAIVFSPDGQIAASAGADKTARLWNVATGEETHCLAGHADEVSALTFSPDGQTLITAGKDQAVCLWDVFTGDKMRCVAGGDWGQAIAFGPDGQTLITAKDQAACLWEAATGKKIRCVAGHTAGVVSAALNPNNSVLVTAGADGVVHLWPTTEEKDFKAHEGEIKSVAFDLGGNVIVTAGADRMACLWEADTGHKIRCFAGHTDAVLSAALSPDGQTLVTAGQDRTARLWNVKTGEEIVRFIGHARAIRAVAFSPNAPTVLTASADGTLRLWGTVAVQEPRLFRDGATWVRSAAFSADTKTILTASADGAARLWDRTTGKEIRVITHTAPVWSGTFSPDDQTILTAGEDNLAHLWETATGQEIRCFKGHTATVSSAAFSPDGRMAITASDDNTARLWNVMTGEEIRRVAHAGRVWSAAFGPEGETILTAGEDKIACLWETATGRKIRCLEGHQGRVNSAAYSPDGKTIVTASEDKTACLWETSTGKKRRCFTGHTDRVLSAAFGKCISAPAQTKDSPQPCSEMIVTASADETVRLWDAATGREIRRLTGHTGWVRSAVVSVDGHMILTASDDGTARLWLVRIEELLRLAGDLVQREPPLFTPEERRRFGFEGEWLAR